MTGDIPKEDIPINAPHSLQIFAIIQRGVL